MKTLKFTAKKVGVEEDEYALVAGVVCFEPYQYVTFQRDAEDSNEDWGVYFEFNDQINSKYECIQTCSVKRDHLAVELVEPIDRQKQILTLEVRLEIEDSEFKSFGAMLRRIFRGKDSLLILDETL